MRGGGSTCGTVAGMAWALTSHNRKSWHTAGISSMLQCIWFLSEIYACTIRVSLPISLLRSPSGSLAATQSQHSCFFLLPNTCSVPHFPPCKHHLPQYLAASASLLFLHPHQVFWHLLQPSLQPSRLLLSIQTTNISCPD